MNIKFDSDFDFNLGFVNSKVELIFHLFWLIQNSNLSISRVGKPSFKFSKTLPHRTTEQPIYKVTYMRLHQALAAKSSGYHFISCWIFNLPGFSFRCFKDFDRFPWRKSLGLCRLTTFIYKAWLQRLFSSYKIAYQY